MKLGLSLPYAGKKIRLPDHLISEAEALGYDAVWVAEVYGSDAVSIAAWILARTNKIRVGTAIMQIPARTPACAASTAMSLAQLSEGRFILGLGASGPQVVEGWHGVAYSKPVMRTREYIQIIRKIMAREGPTSFEGQIYQLPLKGQDASGLGKPLKSLLAADTSIPIYTASFTPAGLTAAGEVADGVFPIWLNPERTDLIVPHVEKGLAKSGRTLQDFDIAPNVPVALGNDLDICRAPIKEFLGLYIGGMGAREKNFYNDYTRKLGYEDEARKIQDLYLSGHKRDAVALVPDQLVDDIALVGPKDRIANRAQAWKEAAKNGHVGSLLLSTQQPEALGVLAEVFL
jgi:F420-dependent oxidoreductase-like protein